jgi:hypothetical protein
MRRIEFTRSRWFLDGVPLGASLLLHAGIVLFAIATYQAVQGVRQLVEEQVIIPDSTVIENAPVGGVEQPGTLSEELMRLVDKDASRSALEARQSAEINRAVIAGEGESSRLIGLGPSVSSGQSDTPGTGGGNPFGVPGGGLAPPANFAGISSNARKVVFLCDASGTMMSVFDDLKQQLRLSVDKLAPVQAFNIIFFKDENVLTYNREGLTMASAANKSQAFNWISRASSAGSTNPLPGIRLAFAQQPELIYVLTDGFDNVDSFDAVIAEFRRLNRDRRTRVNTILIRSSDDQQLEQVLRTIAQDSGGVFKAIDRGDFGR